MYAELWVSFASLLRSYTAAHGLNGDRQATVELGEEQITVRHGNAWLELKRNGAQVLWSRNDERSGMLEMTEAGRLRSLEPWSPKAGDLGQPGENEMDIVAEAWARELMR